MLEVFLPDCYVEHYNKIDFAKLKQRRIKVLLCDIDNTLAAHDCAHASNEVLAFFRHVEAQSIHIAVVSNNTKARVAAFLQPLPIYYVGSAKKPLHFAFKRVQRHFQVSKREMAMLGDQLLTDVLGANRFGITSILTTPLVERDIRWTKFNRRIEAWVYQRLEKTYQFQKGVYYHERKSL